MSEDSKFGKYCPAEAKSIGEYGAIEDPRVPVEHYMRGGMECIDALKAISTKEEFTGHLRLNAIKYLWRLGEKDDPAREVKKALDYVTWLHDELKED